MIFLFKAQALWVHLQQEIVSWTSAIILNSLWCLALAGPQGFSKDVLKCNKSSLEEEENLPEAPTQCYRSTKRTCSRTQTLRSPLDNWQYNHNLATSQLNNCQPPTNAPTSDWRGSLGDYGSDFLSPNIYCGHSSSAINALDFHFFNHNAAIASATLPHQRKSRPPHRWPHADVLCHQALSDWCNNQAKAGQHMSPCHPRISYDHPGPALRPVPAFDPSTNSDEYHKETSLLYHHQAAANSNNPSWLEGQDSPAASVNQSWSKSLVNAYDEYDYNYKCSVKPRAKASLPILSYYKKSSTASRKTIPSSCFPITSATAQPIGQPSGQIAEPQTRRVKEKPVGDESCNPFSIDGHIMKHAQSMQEPSHGGPHQYWRPADSEVVLVTSPPSPVPSVPEEDEALISLRKKAASRCQNPMETLQRPPDNTSLYSPKPHNIGLASESFEDSTSCKTNNSLAQHAFNLVSSIPLIG